MSGQRRSKRKAAEELAKETRKKSKTSSSYIPEWKCNFDGCKMMCAVERDGQWWCDFHANGLQCKETRCNICWKPATRTSKGLSYCKGCCPTNDPKVEYAVYTVECAICKEGETAVTLDVSYCNDCRPACDGCECEHFALFARPGGFFCASCDPGEETKKQKDDAKKMEKERKKKQGPLCSVCNEEESSGSVGKFDGKWICNLCWPECLVDKCSYGASVVGKGGNPMCKQHKDDALCNYEFCFDVGTVPIEGGEYNYCQLHFDGSPYRLCVRGGCETATANKCITGDCIYCDKHHPKCETCKDAKAAFKYKGEFMCAKCQAALYEITNCQFPGCEAKNYGESIKGKVYCPTHYARVSEEEKKKEPEKLKCYHNCDTPFLGVRVLKDGYAVCLVCIQRYAEDGDDRECNSVNCHKVPTMLMGGVPFCSTECGEEMEPLDTSLCYICGRVGICAPCECELPHCIKCCDESLSVAKEKLEEAKKTKELKCDDLGCSNQQDDPHKVGNRILCYQHRPYYSPEGTKLLCSAVDCGKDSHIKSAGFVYCSVLCKNASNCQVKGVCNKCRRMAPLGACNCEVYGMHCHFCCTQAAQSIRNRKKGILELRETVRKWI